MTAHDRIARPPGADAPARRSGSVLAAAPQPPYPHGIAAERYRSEVRRSADALAALRRENEQLRGRVQALATALRGLASDLAASRRVCNLRETEIALLQAELRVASQAASGSGGRGAR